MESQESADAVRAAEAAYDAAWNAVDLDRLLRCFTADAVLVNPYGEVAIGIEAIRARLTTFLHGPARGSRHTSRLVRISFVTTDVAVVDGEARLEGVHGSGTLEHRFTDVLVRQGTRWLIAHVRAYALTGGAAGA